MLTYALACNTGTFAAIGPDWATQPDNCAAPHPTAATSSWSPWTAGDTSLWQFFAAH